MSKKGNTNPEKRGLGEVVYSVDPESELEKRQRAEAAAVSEASRESFPASDAPGFTGVVADGDVEHDPDADDNK